MAAVHGPISIKDLRRWTNALRERALAPADHPWEEGGCSRSSTQHKVALWLMGIGLLSEVRRYNGSAARKRMLIRMM